MSSLKEHYCLLWAIKFINGFDQSVLDLQKIKIDIYYFRND